MRLKEKYYGTTLWGVVIFILICVAMCSCSTPATLTEPNKSDLVIIKTDSVNQVLVCYLKDAKVLYWPECDTLKVGVLYGVEE